MRKMKISVMLEPDVAALLERVRKMGLKKAVNEALRSGLRQSLRTPRSAIAYQTKSVDLGVCLIGSLDDVSTNIGAAEGDSFR